jgi:hypothetical protein
MPRVIRPKVSIAGRSTPSAGSVATVALTKPLHVRQAAAALFNDSRKRWGQEMSAAQVRALAQVLSLSRQVIFDTVIEARVTAMEKRFGLMPGDELDGAESIEDSEDPRILADS